MLTMYHFLLQNNLIHDKNIFKEKEYLCCKFLSYIKVIVLIKWHDYFSLKKKT